MKTVYLFLLILLSVGTANGYHWHDQNLNSANYTAMDPVKWINGNNTAYFKLKLAEYNAVMDLKVQNGGVRDDLPSYLARVWLVPDISPDILSCDLEGDACRIPTFDQVLPGSGRWEQEARYAILQQIGNWHAIFQNLLAQSEEGEQTVGLELPSMVKQLSWTDEMDAWRNRMFMPLPSGL